MSTSTKWILGIGVSLVVIALLVSAGTLVFNNWYGHGGLMMPHMDPYYGRVTPTPWDEMPLHRDWGFPMTTGWMFPGLWTIGIGLFCLGVIALIILGIVALMRVINRPAAPPVAPDVISPAATHACPNCERLVQAEWTYCPHCGQEQVAT